MNTSKTHKTALGEFPIIHQSDNLSIVPIKTKEPIPGIKFAPNYGSPYANPLVDEAIKSLNQVVTNITTPKKLGPSIGSGGFVIDDISEHQITNHEPDSPRK